MVDFATVWQAADGRTLAEARRRGLVVPVIIGPSGGTAVHIVDELPGTFEPDSIYFVGPQHEQYVVDPDGNAFPIVETPTGNIDLGTF